MSWALGVNGLGLAMLLLTAFLTPIVLLASWGEVSADRQDRFTGLVLVLESFVVVVFAARDVFLFYLCFEAMLIPVYFLIGCSPEFKNNAIFRRHRFHSIAHNCNLVFSHLTKHRIALRTHPGDLLIIISFDLLILRQ